MTKLFTSVRLAALAALSVGTLAGCELYFGGDEGGDNWDYCGADGRYTCQGDNCEWVSPDCDGPSATACTSDEQCAAGCYCDEASGVCVEGGFCTTDADCPDGTVCDQSRSSCEVPEGTPCNVDTDCASGEVCTNGVCTATCVCGSDAEAQANGFGFCDEATSTCKTGEDPAGTCIADEATITCNIKQPNCPAGETALAKDGCYTGECRAISQCGIAVACPELQDLTDCQNENVRCAVVATGTNCKKPDGTLCQPGDTNCTCDNFSFERCEDRAGAVPDPGP